MEDTLNIHFPKDISNIIITYTHNTRYELEETEFYGSCTTASKSIMIGPKLYEYGGEEYSFLRVNEIVDGYVIGIGEGHVFLYNSDIYVLYAHVIHVLDDKLCEIRTIKYENHCLERFAINDDKIYFTSGFLEKDLYISELSGKILKKYDVYSKIRSLKVIDKMLYILLDDGIMEISDKDRIYRYAIPNKPIHGYIKDFYMIDSKLYICDVHNNIYVVYEDEEINDFAATKTNMHEYMTFGNGYCTHKTDVIDNKLHVRFRHTNPKYRTKEKISILQITKTYYMDI